MAKKVEDKIIWENKFEGNKAELKLQKNGVLLFNAKPTYTFEENTSETKWLKDSFKELTEKFPDIEFKILIDVADVGNSEQMTEETKKIYVDLINDPKIEKIAVYGQTWGMQIILDLLSALSRTNKLKSFSNEEKAIAWLNS
ncbi:STAS/SEC14 domain-containing protein [Patescibacteria group bacterium]|nr:STAS/SEC14 domain-containing protein [Patescibacteria group bacterium]MBU1673399.1 STAS/SEC14 domain-containing protein [Patescibacteria group bacterium]MBU1963303.1 STAS/SEC14 domain-containing protein [Patescibacteria group bacterium]